MKGAIAVSIVFHIAVVILGTMGLPYLRKPPPLMSDPIAVDIVEIDEITTTNKPPVQSRVMKEPEKLEAPKEEKPPAPPKMTAEAPPKSVPPEPTKLKEEVAEKPKPKIPPPPSEKLKEPPPKKPEPPEKEPEVQQKQDFASLLKNLQDSEPTPVPEAEVNPEAEAQKMSPLAQFSQRLTMSEADALKRQLSQCWSIQAGARYAEDLVVEVKLFMNPDRSVRQAVILNQWRYNQDSYFRAAADSAIRAVRSPMCNPLELPPDKYQMWKEIEVNFDPREML